MRPWESQGKFWPMASGKKEGPGFPGPWVTQQPPFTSIIALASCGVKFARPVAGLPMPPRWPSAAPLRLRGRDSNPHEPLERRLLYQLSYPAVPTLHTAVSPKMFPREAAR